MEAVQPRGDEEQRALFNWADGDNPCRYCTPDLGRDEDCHSRCQRYLAFFIQGKETREIRQEMQRAGADARNYQRDKLPRYRRKNKR